MTYLTAFLLGLIQGVAEFLPISSSGHLAIAQNLLGMSEAGSVPEFFDVLLHLGTLVAVFAAYWHEICDMVVELFRGIGDLVHRTTPTPVPPARRLILLIIVGTLPLFAVLPIRKAVQAVKDEVLVYNGSVCDAVWSASAGYNTQTGVYGTCSSRDAWGTDVPYLQSVESPYEEQYHKLLRRVIGKDYTYIEYNDSRTGEPYQSADTTHKDLGGFVQYNTLVSNGRSYRYINQFVSSRYCFDFGTDASGTPCMTYYGYGHGVGMSQCGAVGYAAEEGMNYKQILQHYYTGAKIRTSTTRSGGLFGWLAGLFR